MKRRRLPPDKRLKKRYNLCHRLRLKGVAVDTDSNAINIANQDEYEALPATTRRYVDTLRSIFPAFRGKFFEQKNTHRLADHI